LMRLTRAEYNEGGSNAAWRKFGDWRRYQVTWPLETENGSGKIGINHESTATDAAEDETRGTQIEEDASNSMDVEQGKKDPSNQGTAITPASGAGTQKRGISKWRGTPMGRSKGKGGAGSSTGRGKGSGVGSQIQDDPGNLRRKGGRTKSRRTNEWEMWISKRFFHDAWSNMTPFVGGSGNLTFELLLNGGYVVGFTGKSDKYCMYFDLPTPRGQGNKSISVAITLNIDFLIYYISTCGKPMRFIPVLSLLKFWLSTELHIDTTSGTIV
jgi:hypothetical protein